MSIKTQRNMHRINGDIRAPEIRLILEDGEQGGIVSRAEALKSAEDAGLDLVEISPNTKPPVCKIMGYGKFLYQSSKQAAKAKKNHKEIIVKEIKLRPATGEEDYRVKLRKIIAFLIEGKKVKVTLRFLGRELAHRELGDQKMERIVTEIEEHGTVEARPKLQGRQITMVLAPKRGK